MNQYNFPTIILSGQGALNSFVDKLKNINHKKILLITDNTLKELGIVKKVTDILSDNKIPYAVFSDTHPNPVEQDVSNAVKAYKSHKCDSIIALGGGSPIDLAKTVKIMATHPEPLNQYDDCLGGDRLITQPMPPLYAIPTTAGTGSEVGRSSVIIMKETRKKTIFFHPDLIPCIAVLEPELTVDLPKNITAATGIDAFSHCLEAYFSPGFHPMADGIAFQGIELILESLPQAYSNGKNLEARERMLIAASMGATAFQKGLGMIHSMAHPLSSKYNLHHGLGISLILPVSIDFLEKSNLNNDQKKRMTKIHALFKENKFNEPTLSLCCKDFILSLGIKLGLSNYNIPESELEELSQNAYNDPCHLGNMIEINHNDLLQIYKAAY